MLMDLTKVILADDVSDDSNTLIKTFSQTSNHTKCIPFDFGQNGLLIPDF